MAGSKAGGEKRWLEAYPLWVKECNEIHGHKYTYSTGRVFEGGRPKAVITCPEHGEFHQMPAKHKSGQGCPKCSHGTTDNRLKRLRQAFPDTEFPDPLPPTKSKMTLTCQEHGEFQTTINQLLSSKALAGTKACPKCNQVEGGIKRRLDQIELLERLLDQFPAYTFYMTKDTKTQSSVDYDCPDHGPHRSRVSDMLNGHGCPKCGGENRTKAIGEVLAKTPDQHLADLIATHGGSLIFYKQDLVRTHTKVRAVCPKHGVFESMLYSLKAGHGCPKCTSRISGPEQELLAWFKDLGVETKIQCNETIKGAHIDLVLPEHKIAIEYCGLYWHSEERRGKSFHLERLNKIEAVGMRLVTIFEDEWLANKDLVKSTLLKLIGFATDRVFARKTEVRHVTWDVVSAFYSKHHLQGAGTPCGDNRALFAGDEVVAAMSFKAARFQSDGVELMRYATSKTVVGGFTKLLKAYTEEAQTGTTITSYCDLRWFTGGVYEKAGFTKVGQSAPGYWWCRGIKRHSRFAFQKHKLAEKLTKFDETMTEEENMTNNGYWKIWDCGMSKWVLTV